MITRAIAKQLSSSQKSILLLGPRQTGKSTLMGELGPDLVINLAHEATYLAFASNPNELEERLQGLRSDSKQLAILIDEVQRLPSLLNTIQSLLDLPQNRFKFLLTGSSARKLKRGQANLLPGRIHTYFLGPLVSHEFDYSVQTSAALSFGTLPGIYTEETDDQKSKTLRSYAATYLREEIQAEALSRNLEGFARFLNVVGQWAGNFLDLSKIAQAAQVSRQSAQRWFEVLEDTLLVNRVEPFAKKLSTRLVQHPKFYFFDVGVLNGLLNNFVASPDRIDSIFEHFIYNQLVHSAAALDKEIRISTFRTEHGNEVDFILDIDQRIWALEVKASAQVMAHDLRGVKRFQEVFGKKCEAMVLYLGKERKKVGPTDVLPWQEGLKELGF